MNILGISGTLVGSKPALLVEKSLASLANQHDVTMVDLKQLKLDFCDGRPLHAYSEDTQTLAQQLQQADALIIGTTVLHGSIAAPLKNFFELMPIDAFRHKSVLFLVNGGNASHALVVEHVIKPITNYLHMYNYPDYAFIPSAAFTTGNELEQQYTTTLQQLTAGFEAFAQTLAELKEEVV